MQEIAVSCTHSCLRQHQIFRSTIGHGALLLCDCLMSLTESSASGLQALEARLQDDLLTLGW